MTAEPEPSLRDVLNALTETNARLGSLTSAIQDLSHATRGQFEGLGRAVAGVDACVAKLQVALRPAGGVVADADAGESADPAPEPAAAPAAVKAPRRPRRGQHKDIG